MRKLKPRESKELPESQLQKDLGLPAFHQHLHFISSGCPQGREISEGGALVCVSLRQGPGLCEYTQDLEPEGQLGSGLPVPELPLSVAVTVGRTL